MTTYNESETIMRLQNAPTYTVGRELTPTGFRESLDRCERCSARAGTLGYRDHGVWCEIHSPLDWRIARELRSSIIRIQLHHVPFDDGYRVLCVRCHLNMVLQEVPYAHG